MHAALSDLKAVGLPLGHWALFGSGPLLARGWLKDVGDLDVLARGPAWAHAERIGQMRHLEEYDIDVIVIGEWITVGRTWAIGDFAADDLIDTAETIGGVPCVRLEHVIAYKEIARRAKDLDHLAVITERLSQHPL